MSEITLQLSSRGKPLLGPRTALDADRKKVAAEQCQDLMNEITDVVSFALSQDGLITDLAPEKGDVTYSDGVTYGRLQGRRDREHSNSPLAQAQNFYGTDGVLELSYSRDGQRETFDRRDDLGCKTVVRDNRNGTITLLES